MAEPTATNAAGEKIVFRGGQWVPLAEAASAAPASSFPGVIQGRPKAAPEPTPKNPYDIQSDQRDYTLQAGNTAFDNAGKLRGEFNGLPAVQEYQTVIRQYDSALKTEPTPTGDQALITAYAKMLDPTSVVREAEFSTVADGDSAVGKLFAKIQKEGGFDGAGLLRPEVRDRLRNEMLNLVKSYNGTYNQAREQYLNFAKQGGVDPNLVVGEHLGAPFVDDIKDAREEYYSRKSSVNEPTNADIYRNGVQFGGDGGSSPFDRSQYLQQNYGLTPEKEDRIVGMWNAQLRNPNLTVEAVKQWYAQEGVAPPTDQDIAATIEEAKKGVPFSGIDTIQAEKKYTGGLDKVLAQRGADPESMSGAVGVNAMQGIMMEGGDEIAGAGGFINAAVQGQNPVAGYQAERDLIRREQQRAQAAHPTASTVANVAGTLVTGGTGFGTTARAAGLAGKALEAGNTARASALGRTAVRASVAPGAATGAAYGYNSGEGTVNSLAQGAIGAASGAALSPLVQTGANALAPKVANALSKLPTRNPPTNEQRALIEAGARREVPIRQPDVRPEVRGEYGVARTSGKGGPIIRAAEGEDVGAMERAVARDVAGGRPSIGREGVGTQAATAVNRKRDRLYNEAKVWYNRADSAAGGTPVAPTEALARLDNTIATLKQNGANSNGKTISYLEGLREDFANGLTVAGIRDQRTNMRANIREAGLDVNKTEALVLDIIEGASTDLRNGLANNPGALGAYNKADKLWAERATFTKEMRNRLLGPKGDKSPTAVADGIKQLARDDFGKFQKFWDVLEPDEQADIAATFAISQGRDNAGNWSPARFVSDLTGSDLGTKANIDPKVARLMFGEDGMRAIADLRAIAGAKKAAASEVNNSRTGNVVQKVGRGLKGLMLTGLGFAGGGVGGAVVLPAAGQVLTSLGEKRAARLLLNPDFTKWLRNAPNTSDPRAIDRYFVRLDGLAARSPIMAADAAAFKASLRAANDGGAARLAAEPGSTDDPRDVQQ